MALTKIHIWRLFGCFVMQGHILRICQLLIFTIFSYFCKNLSGVLFLRKFMNVPILKNFPPICHYFLGFRVGKCSASQDSTPRRLGRLFDAAFPRPCHISALHINFQGNRYTNIVICSIFAALGNYQG